MGRKTVKRALGWLLTLAVTVIMVAGLAPSAWADDGTPTADFEATGYNTGTLTGVEAGMRYSLNGGATWTDVTGSDDISLTRISPCTIQVVRKGNGTTTVDSDAQEIEVTRADKPTGITAADCTTVSNDDGKLSGVTASMEHQKSGADSWTEGTGDDITGLAPGTYHVRIKAADTTLASDSQELTITEYVAHVHSFTYDASGEVVTATCSNSDGKCKLDDGTAQHNHVVTLVIEARDATYDGSAHGVTLTADAWTAAGLTIPSIQYGGSGSTSYSDTDAPTDAGDYTASITLGEGEGAATASVDYTIAKAGISPTVSIEGWTYGEAAKSPSLGDGSNPGGGEVTYEYAKKGSASFSPDVPTGVGDYTVRATVAETANYLGGTATADFAITSAKATLTFDLAGGTLDGQTGKVTVEANVNDTVKLLAAPVREGYTFLYWKGSEYAAGAEYLVEGDHDFTAVWEKDASKPTSKKSGKQSSTTTRAKASATPNTGDLTSFAAIVATAGFGVASFAGGVALNARTKKRGKHQSR